MLGHRFRVLAGSLLAGVLLVAASGCGDDPRPKIDPDASVTWTPYSGEPSESESSDSTTSAAADPLTPVQTVRAWIRAYNQLLGGGDDVELQELSAPSCKTCGWEIDPIVDVQDAGGTFEGDAGPSGRSKLVNRLRRGLASTSLSTLRRVARLSERVRIPSTTTQRALCRNMWSPTTATFIRS